MNGSTSRYLSPAPAGPPVATLLGSGALGPVTQPWVVPSWKLLTCPAVTAPAGRARQSSSATAPTQHILCITQSPPGQEYKPEMARGFARRGFAAKPAVSSVVMTVY